MARAKKQRRTSNKPALGLAQPVVAVTMEELHYAISVTEAAGAWQHATIVLCLEL
jgi:hypothetical protein